MEQWTRIKQEDNAVAYRKDYLTVVFRTDKKIVDVFAICFSGNDNHMDDLIKNYTPLELEDLEFITSKAREIFNEWKGQGNDDDL